MADRSVPPSVPDDPDGASAAGSGISRKGLLRAAMVALPAPLFVGAAAPSRAEPVADTATTLSPTPSCSDGDDPTPEQIEGPYFSPGSPERSDITDGPGTALTLTGYVFGIGCQPLSDVLLDFWQAAANGNYDNVTYSFRGHQYTDGTGAYRLTTIVAGLYPGRTRHIHVKAQAPGQPVLTTQLYFPGEPRNSTDPIFDPALLMTIRDAGGGKEASFDFMLNVSGGGDPGEPGGSWQAGTAYRVGEEVDYGGIRYRCLIAHTAATGWEPDVTPALWQRL